MATKLAYRDGGKTSEEGISRLLSRFVTEDGVFGDNDLLVTENDTPNNQVKVAVGDIVIGKDSPLAGISDYYYHGWVPTAELVTIDSNTSGSSRIDAIVAYVDKSLVDNSSNDNPGVLKFKDVNGTSTAPSDATIQSSVGSGNPWVLLGTISVPNGFASITNANITDRRPKTSSLYRIVSDISQDFVASGSLPSTSANLTTTLPSIRAYVGGQIVTKSAISKTFTASKDTYVDIPKTAKPTMTDDYTYTAVSNGAGEPALASGSLRLYKVVTNASAITSVTDLRKTKPTGTNQINPLAITEALSDPVS